MNKAKKDIQILIVNHKEAYNVSNELLKPIQVGTSLVGTRLNDMKYYDNDGANISDKNQSYCELTAMYWAWKNLDADYYGLFHYRRYLSFSSSQDKDMHPGKAYDSVQSAIEKIGLQEDQMRRIIESHDLIIPRKDSTLLTTGNKSVYDQYKLEHYISDLDYCIEYVVQNYPHLANHVNVLHQSEAYFCNMFIMNKELYNEYCSFMFDVLESFETNNDIIGYNVQQYRVTGYLAERLTNIFLHYLVSKPELRVKELQIAFFENTDKEIIVEPIANKNNIGIALAADNFYVPYMSTLIHSLTRYVKPENTYDINIFHQDITPANMSILKNEFKDFKNISIRFCDMSSRASEYKKLMVKWHFTVETYFRLFIPDIMKNYDKVLYLDGDLVIKTDVAELFNENVEGKVLAAVRDIDMAGVYNSNSIDAENNIDPQRKNYIDNELKIKNAYDYFQAGVLLLNLKEMREAFTTKQAIEFASSRHWEYQDQDVLNYLAQGRVKYLDVSWNVLYDWEFWRIKNVISKAPVKMYRDYMASRNNPKIIHYGGTIKPWQRADCDYGDQYWEVARNSVFYELILSRMAEWRVRNNTPNNPVNSKVRIRTKVARKLRKRADAIAPVGSGRRKPITKASRTLKKIIR